MGFAESTVIVRAVEKHVVSTHVGGKYQRMAGRKARAHGRLRPEFSGKVVAGPC
jgi:hypothetical protein